MRIDTEGTWALTGLVRQGGGAGEPGGHPPSSPLGALVYEGDTCTCRLYGRGLSPAMKNDCFRRVVLCCFVFLSISWMIKVMYMYSTEMMYMYMYRVQLGVESKS